MKYLKQATAVALLMNSTTYLTGCAQQEALAPPSPEAMPAVNNSSITAAPITIDAALNRTSKAVQMLVDQVLWINPSSQSKKWRISLSRHDFAKVVIENHPDKTQHKIAFKTTGTFKLTVSALNLNDSQPGAAPNVMQQQLTVIVKDQ